MIKQNLKALFIAMILAILAMGSSNKLLMQSSPAEYYIAAISPDGTMLAGVSTHGQFHIWDTLTGSMIFDLQGLPFNPFSAVWSPDNKRIAAAGGDDIIRVWCVDQTSTPDCTPGSFLTSIDTDSGPLLTIAWNTAGVLASSGQGGVYSLRTWDTNNGYQPIASMAAGDSNQIAWSPDNNRLALAGPGGLLTLANDLTLDIGSAYLDQYIGPDVPAWSVAWNSNGTQIALGTLEGSIYIFDFATESQLRLLEGHTGIVYALAWNSDDIHLASAGEDGTIRIWDTTTGTAQAIEAAKDIAVTLQIAWSLDGDTLYYPIEDSQQPVGLPTPIATAAYTPTATDTLTPTPTPTPTPSGFDCPCNVFGDSSPATAAWSADSDGVELGMRFRASVAGQVTGVRFYKGTGNSGTHVGHLWTNTGTLLGSVTFTNETSSGWQEATFSTPISISADTTYVVSYHAPVGHYAVDRFFFGSALDNPPLKALASGEDGANGVYSYGGSGTFPTSVFQTTNYWIDVIFVPGVPTPTPTPTPNCPCNIFGSTTPANPSWNDSSAVELGMRFRASEDGEVTGVRFYKGSGNTGTHTGHLWTNAGTLLGSVTFSGETSSGWQEATFSTPIGISANTTYVVSYHAPNGNYSVDRPALVSAVNNPPLKALADDEDGANGVYAYGSSGTFPTNAPTTSTNYWVDVIFVPDEP